MTLGEKSWYNDNERMDFFLDEVTIYRKGANREKIPIRLFFFFFG